MFVCCWCDLAPDKARVKQSVPEEVPADRGRKAYNGTAQCRGEIFLELPFSRQFSSFNWN